MPIGTVTKRFTNEKNIKVTFDNDREKTYSTFNADLYPILVEGATVDYTLKVNGAYTNIVSAVTVGGAPATPAAPAQGSPAPRSSLTDKDTLIVDQVLFKAAIDLMVKNNHDPEGAAEMAVHTWNCILYYRHGGASPMVLEAMKAGGQIVEAPAPTKSGLRDLDIELPNSDKVVPDDSPLAEILNNPPREAGDL
jgi:hypothetical protein|tara:strand:+ start:234 stop:815 length:582 start_codon:yes stop_codon:yes gene_type:complete